MENSKKIKIEKKANFIIQTEEEINLKQARDISVKEGSFASISSGVGHSYISPFAIALGASNAQVGILSSLPGIVAPIAQLLGSRLVEKNSRKKIVLKYVLIEALIWLPILCLALFAYLNLLENYLPWSLIFLYGLLYFVGNLASPAWFSWMGDIVPETIRGKYFSSRNRICGAVALVSMFLAAFLLDLFKTKGWIFLGFIILFLVANISRLISTYFFTKKYEPKLELKDGYYFSFLSFIKKIRQNNFGKFTIFVSLMRLTGFISAPFFAVYMLKNLNFSYFWFTVIIVTTTIFTLLTLPLWGRFSDKYGNKNLLKIGSVLIPLIPLLWAISPNPYYLILGPGIIGGIGWAAFNLASSNFIYDSISPQRRSICIAYHNLVVGAGIIIGGLIGSFLIKYISISFMNNILFIFLVSGILSAIVTLTMLSRIQEPRKVKKTKRLTSAILKEISPLNLPSFHINHPSFWKKYMPKFRQ